MAGDCSDELELITAIAGKYDVSDCGAPIASWAAPARTISSPLSVPGWSLAIGPILRPETLTCRVDQFFPITSVGLPW